MISDAPHGQEGNDHEDGAEVELKGSASREEHGCERDVASASSSRLEPGHTWLKGNEVANVAVDRNQLWKLLRDQL